MRMAPALDELNAGRASHCSVLWNAGIWLAVCSLLAVCHPALPGDRAPRTDPAAAYRITLDLTQSDAYVALPPGSVAARTTVRGLQVHGGPSSGRMYPADGVVRHGRRVDMLLDEKLDVRIRVSLVTRGDQVAVRITPLVGVAAGNPVDFTADRLRRSCWSLQRCVRDLQREIAAIRREQQRVAEWLEMPGNKSLEAYKIVRQRSKNLERRLAAALQELPAIRARCAVYAALMELADRIHATMEISFTVQMTSAAPRQ